jgi:hypothetical protein
MTKAHDRLESRTITKEEYVRLLKKNQVKYKNKRTDTGRGEFASKKEAEYEHDLFLRKREKEIKGYLVQVPIPLEVHGVHICNYVMDFQIDHNDGSFEWVETKGYKTELWKVKWKLLKALYPHVKITLV